MKTVKLQKVSSVRKHLRELNEFLKFSFIDAPLVEEEEQSPYEKWIAKEIETAENSRKFIPKIDL